MNGKTFNFQRLYNQEAQIQTEEVCDIPLENPLEPELQDQFEEDPYPIWGSRRHFRE